MTANERIKAAYKRSGLTRAQFAAACYFPEGTLKNWLRPSDNAGYREAPEYAAYWAEHVAETTNNMT